MKSEVKSRDPQIGFELPYTEQAMEDPSDLVVASQREYMYVYVHHQDGLT